MYFRKNISSPAFGHSGISLDLLLWKGQGERRILKLPGSNATGTSSTM
jgi:hypothetical protein